MKKFVFMLVAILGMTLTGCCDSVDPVIIGTGQIHFNETACLYYVTIDSVNYPVETVICKEDDSNRKLVEAAEGMLVTVFKAENKEGFQAMAGNKNEKQIKDALSGDNIGIIVLAIFLFMFFGWIYLDSKMSTKL